MKSEQPIIIQKILTKSRRLGLLISDAVDLWWSRNLDVQNVRSVCLFLGPYRNLTTLTASILFLHPYIQVLNHAGMRIFGNKKVDFLQDFNKETFDRFTQFAITISGKGYKGVLGGSITYGHAFDYPLMKGIWIKNALSVMKIKSGYEHNDRLLHFYRNYVEEKGARFPDFAEGLLSFVQ